MIIETSANSSDVSIWVPIATFVQVVATLIAAWAAFESRKSAKIAKESVELTAKSMELRDRAYIAFIWAGVRGLKSSDDPLTIHIKFRNIGNTPGSKVGLSYHIGFFKDDENIDYEKLLSKNAISTVLGDAAPSQEFDVNLIYNSDKEFVQLEYDTYKQLKSGELKLHVFGCIVYMDVFGIEHLTTWSKVYDHKDESFPNTVEFNSMN